jgi:hypothetical protein
MAAKEKDYTITALEDWVDDYRNIKGETIKVNGYAPTLPDNIAENLMVIRVIMKHIAELSRAQTRIIEGIKEINRQVQDL